MLLTTKVILKWHSKNRKWYESKGYKFTKWKDEFEVKIKDLTDGTKIYIDVECDKCKEILHIKWQGYKRNVHEDGKYYCQKCAMKLYGGENLRKTLFNKHDKSFYDWCIEHDRQDILDRWDYNLNDCKPNEISYSTHLSYYFNCLQNLHKSELHRISDFTRGQEGSISCHMCNSFAQYLINMYGNNALNLYWNYEKNKNINPWQITKSCTKKVYIKCQEKDYHNSYEIKCNDFTNMNCRCPYCARKKVHPLDSLGKLLEDKGLLDLWSNKNEKSPYEFLPMSHNKVWWKCPDGKHGDYYRGIDSSNNICNFRCPECVQERDESFLQEKVRLYLENLNKGKYTILHEHKCTIVPQNPKTKKLLPFDNEIKELKLVCEVHGLQHYEICSWHKSLAKKHNTTPEYELHMQQVRDRYKRFIAYKNGYNYIAIPYWTDNKQEEWKELINNKMKENKIK